MKSYVQDHTYIKGKKYPKNKVLLFIMKKINKFYCIFSYAITKFIRKSDQYQLFLALTASQNKMFLNM